MSAIPQTQQTTMNANVSEVPIRVETLTPEEYKKILDSKEFEIINNEIRRKSMAGARHGRIGMKIGTRLTNYVETNALGEIYGADTSFRIGKNTRQPDVSFVSFERFPESGEPIGAWQIAPDLAVEVISPTNTIDEISEKIDEYFAASVKQIWIVEPNRKTISVYTSPTQVQILTENDELICEGILPNFRLKLTEIFHAPNKTVAS